MPNRQFATLRNTVFPDHEVEIIDWALIDDPIPGYVKVMNVHGVVHVVREERLTNQRQSR